MSYQDNRFFDEFLSKNQTYRNHFSPSNKQIRLIDGNAILFFNGNRL
jgi:hypothetical protein